MLIYAADDERLALNMLRDAIAEAQPEAEIRPFRQAAQLLQAAAETPPDVAFLDVEMPGMTGLTLARRLYEIKEEINIIFVTGYRQYAADAFDVFASGYITKPCTAENIRQALEHLRFPLQRSGGLRIRTFGNFDVFYHGEPVSFRSAKSKELLAYLVDRQGALVTRQEAAAVLFEDDFSRSVQSRLSQFAQRLAEDLTAAGLPELFSGEGGYSVNLADVACDLTEYLAGKSEIRYTGEYMQQYSWAEDRKGEFER